MRQQDALVHCHRITETQNFNASVPQWQFIFQRIRVEKKNFDLAKYPLQQETDFILRTAIGIHKILGAGFLEIVYKDAFEYETRKQDFKYEREKEYPVYYKGRLLRRKFNADFIMYDKIILEVKAKESLCNEDIAQTINYVKLSGCKLGLL